MTIFFNSASVLLKFFMCWAQSHHSNETFTISISMSRLRSIYLVFMWSVFHFQPDFNFINHITLFNQRYLFFAHFLEYLLLFLDDNVDEKSELFSNSKSSTSGCCCLVFAWFFANFSLALLIKVLFIKKAYILLNDKI